MNDDLDILEHEILKAIFKCSAFDYQTIKKVYLELKSFDKTIIALKTQVSTGQSLYTIVNNLKKLL